jgi:hypothetical protein
MRARSAAHIKENMWIWIGLFSAATAAAAAARWGSTAACLASVLGILLMWKSDEHRLAALAAEMAAEEDPA